MAVDKYRQRMQLEQYFRDGKRYLALYRATVITPERLLRLLVEFALGCCVLLLAGRRAL